MNDSIYPYLFFSHCLGIGPITFNALLNRFGTAKACFKLSDSDIKSNLHRNAAEEFIRYRPLFDPVKIMNDYRSKGITILCRIDKNFPQALQQLEDSPICVYVKGDINAYNFEEDVLVAIVGTRKPTSYGNYLAKRFGTTLAAAGCVIVSGMAVGIDGAAHQAALSVGGRTIAILGCGVDIIYPSTNRGLYDAILKKGGLLISEFPPGMTVEKGLFVARNRLISGISRAVLLIEGASTSGALITARNAGIQGKDVYAPPVPINSSTSEAPLICLREGCKLALSPEDMLLDFNISVKSGNNSIIADLPEEEKNLGLLLAKEACSVDDLIRNSKLPLTEVIGMLETLEIKKIVKKNGEGKYELAV